MLKPLVGLLVAVLLIGGCTHASTSTYDAADVGRTIETASGTVLASRPVDIKGGTTAAGPLAGGALGGATGGLTFGSGWAAVIGAVVGAGVGYVAEQQINNREGTEYVVEMDDGRTVTIVQNRESGRPPLPDGTHVMVQYSGQYTRIMEDPRPAKRGGGSGPGGWVDPDVAGPASSTPDHGNMAAPSPDTWEEVDPVAGPTMQH